ncbi:MAG: hypothetical protein IJZ82_04985 [Lachnospiraceae bacterium]|nr:hypothetical protein [Lachnospiraceae bacterium]
MKIKCVWEHNGNDTLLYSSNFIGAFTRGASKEIALSKMQSEVEAYLRWKNEALGEISEVSIEQEKASTIDVCDADSDVIFEEEKKPLTMDEYRELKALALKSARDFLVLYESIPDKHVSCLEPKKTFLGMKPCTAEEMYVHTKSVNSYYFGEIGVDADNESTIYDCRKRGFEELEKQGNFLENKVILGSYDEEWSLRKVLRRFIWHDRIHGKAMYRMAVKTFGAGSCADVFRFEG